MDKKIEFDLSIKGINETLIDIIESAGYTIDKDSSYFEGYSEGDLHIDCIIKTNETANTKDDVIKFVDDINKVSNLNLKIVGMKVLDNDRCLGYHTKDCIIGGETFYTDSFWSDKHFQLAYSKEGNIFKGA